MTSLFYVVFFQEVTPSNGALIRMAAPRTRPGRVGARHLSSYSGPIPFPRSYQSSSAPLKTLLERNPSISTSPLWPPLRVSLSTHHSDHSDMSQPTSRSPSPSYAAVVAGATPLSRRHSSRLASNASASSAPPHVPLSPAPPTRTTTDAHLASSPVPQSVTSAVPPPPTSLISPSPATQPPPAGVSRPLQDLQPHPTPTTRQSKGKGKGKQNVTPPQGTSAKPQASSSRTRQPAISRQQVVDVQADVLTQADTLASLVQTVRAHRVANLRDMELLSARLNGKGTPPEHTAPEWESSLDTLSQRLEDVETVLRADLTDTDRDLSRRIAATEDRILVIERRGVTPQVRARPQPPSPSPPIFRSRSRSRSLTQKSSSRSRSPPPQSRPHSPLPAPVHIPPPAPLPPKRSRSPAHDSSSSRPPKKSRSSRHHHDHVDRASCAPAQSAMPPPSTTQSRSSVRSSTNIAPFSLPPTFALPPTNQTPSLFGPAPPNIPAPPTHDTLAPAEAAYLRLHGVRLTAFDTDLWSPDRARNHRVFRDIVLHLPHQQPPISNPNRNTHISARISDFFFQSPEDLVAFLLAWEVRPADLHNLSASRIPSSLLGEIVARDPPGSAPPRRGNGGSRGRGGFWAGQGGRAYDAASY